MAHLFRSSAIVLLALVSLAGSAIAQPEDAAHRLGDNLYTGGMDVGVSGEGLKSVFAAGESVSLRAAIAGTAHMVGRDVRFEAPVGGSLYGAGFSVAIDAPVTGSAIAAGYDVEITAKGSLGGDALLAGRYVRVDGPVAGHALLTGDVVEIGAPIGGSAEIRAREIRFKPGARIDGTLSYWSDKTLAIPAEIVSADRVTAHLVDLPVDHFARDLVGGLVVMLLVLLVAGALFILALMPLLSGARAALVKRPWWTFLAGIVALSALFGSIFVLAISLIGIPLIPVVLLLTPFLLAAGYLTSAYALGGALLDRLRANASSQNRWAALGALVIGLVVLGLLHSIPIFGWVVGVAATLLGLGALARRLLGGPASAVAA
jgi:cytoskeletal protein CcmA (bactofilin family)